MVEPGERFAIVIGEYRAAMPESYEPPDGRRWAVNVVFGAILAILVVRAATDRLDGRAARMNEPQPESHGGGEEAPERPAGLPA
jgi:hypothetical protein